MQSTSFECQNKEKLQYAENISLIALLKHFIFTQNNPGIGSCMYMMKVKWNMWNLQLFFPHSYIKKQYIVLTDKFV